MCVELRGSDTALRSLLPPLLPVSPPSSLQVRLYNEKSLVYSLHYRLPVSCFRFGPFGREDCALCLVHSNGALSVNILKRQARLDGPSATAGPPAEQDIPLNVPKKTKLYVEQTQRERDQSTEMHRLFQVRE